MSLLDICTDAARELGITAPSAIVGNTDNRDAMIILRMAKKEGYLLAQRAFWTVLTKEHTFSTLAAADQGADSLPDDLDCIVPETIFNHTLRREVAGPVSRQDWAKEQATLITSVNPAYRIRGRSMLLTPTPSAGESVVYEYISKNWALSENDDEQDTFLADTDTTVFPEAIVTAGVIWRYKAHKGYEFRSSQLEYERMVTDFMMRDGCKPRIDTTVVNGPTVMNRGKARMNDYNTIPS